MDIFLFAEHQDVILNITDWFYDEWSYLNPDKTKQDMIQGISQRINTDKIPTALVAFEGHELIGTVSLMVHDMDTHKDLSPWLAGLYVKESWRGRGMGAELVKAIEQKAINSLMRKQSEKANSYNQIAIGNDNMHSKTEKKEKNHEEI